MLRNPNLLSAVPNLTDYVSDLISQGIITLSLLESAECSYLISLCSEVAGNIFRNYKPEYSDREFIKAVGQNQICIDFKSINGLLAILRLTIIASYGEADEQNLISNDPNIQNVLQAAAQDPEVSVYISNLNAYRKCSAEMKF